MNYPFRAVRNRQRSLPRLTLLFVGVTAITSVVWTVTILTVFESSPADYDGVVGVGILLGAMVLSGVPAAYIHQCTPDPVDRFHAFGILFAMFAIANLLVTIGFFVVLIKYGRPMTPVVQQTLKGVVVSSLFLPGPYAGIVIARRWLA
jgi:hypothetical protein